MSDLNYSIDDIGLKADSYLDELTPASQNTFTDGGTVDGTGATEVPGVLFYGKTDFDNTQSGYRLGVDTDKLGKFYIGNTSQYLNWTGSALNIAGALSASSIDIPDTTTANSFHVNSAGDAWWGATAIGSALAKVLKTGAATFTNVTITGGAISSTPISGIPNDTSTDISLLTWMSDVAYSITDADTVAWGSHTITLSNGRTFSISAGNTGNMAAKTYIYLDPSASTTVLQTTTTASSAIGANKILVATAQNGTGEASFVALNDKQMNIDASNIVANSITANEIAASTITGTNISTLNISGKNATFDTGTIGGFTMSATQLTATNFSVTSGAANTARVEVGTGSNTGGINSANGSSDITFWSGAAFSSRASAPFRVDAAGNLTATSATISGYVVSGKGAFGGNGADGALSISSGTTTLSFGSALTLTKNYSSVSITGTATLGFSNPHTNGSIAIIKSQGNFTGTSTTVIDCSSMGGSGGTASPASQQPGNSGSRAAGNVSSAGGATAAAGFTGTDVGVGGTTPGFLGLIAGKVVALTAGGGGSSGTTNTNAAGNSGAGARGGGALYIECGAALNISGIFTVAGATGSNGTNGGGSNTGTGGGGGGGGGTIVILYKTLTANTATLTVSGGSGGSGGTSTAGGTGGAGGGGGGGAATAGSNGSTTGTDDGGAGGTGGTGSSLVAENLDFA